VLVTDSEGYEAVRSFLPADAKIIERQPRFLKRGELIVIGREPPTGFAARHAKPRDAEGPPIEQARRDEETFDPGSLRR
jgi:hypothetical protein